MIKLVGNELKKIFKKKTIYILIIITFGYILLSNIMIKATDNGYSRYYYYEGDLEIYEEMMSELDLEDPLERAQYIDTKNDIELGKLTKKYGNDSWQAYVINNMLTPYLHTILSYEYSDEISEEEYNEAKKYYDDAIQKMDADDWRSFVNEDLEKINNSLEEQYKLKETETNEQVLASIESTIYDLEIQKQVDEWRLEKDISYAPSFLNEALETYYGAQIALKDAQNGNYPQEIEQYNSLLEQANLNKYYIDNNLSLDSNNREIFLNLFSQYELFILIIGIVIAGSIVSEEFNRGTIKLLLVKPYKRVKILLAKFIAVMIVLVMSIVFIAICQVIIGTLVFGFEGLTIPAIVYNFNTNTVETINIFAYVALIGICKLPIYVLLTTLAFACSTLFTNTALAVSIPFLGYIAAPLLNQLAIAYKIKAITYFVTPNWDLSTYLFGGTPMFEGLTMPFSIAICAIYLAIMLILSCVVFKKRDIKNI